MKLSELAASMQNGTFQLTQDCEIDELALCTDLVNGRVLTYLEKEKYISFLDQANVVAVICTETLLPKLPKWITGVIVSAAPKYAFYCMYNAWQAQKPIRKIPTVIGKGCKIAPTAVIAPYNVVIGEDTVIAPGVVVEEFVTIGDRVRIDANSVIGSSSFSAVRCQDRAITLMDAGRVMIGSDVEIRSLCSIERGVFPGDVTVLSDGVKIDQLVLVSHGSKIGERSFIAGSAYIAGNCIIGKDVWIGGNSTISNRIHVGDGARVSLGAVVTKDVSAGQTVTGNFAIDHQTFLKNLKASL